MGGEVLSGGLVGRRVEPENHVLEQLTHLGVRDHVGVQVDSSELLDDHVQDLGFGQLVGEVAGLLHGVPLR